MLSKRNIYLLVTAIALGVSTSVLAKPPGPSPEKRIERLSQELQLDESQVAQLSEIINAQHKKMKGFKEQHQADIEAVLNEEQKAKFRELKEQHKARRKQKMQQQ